MSSASQNTSARFVSIGVIKKSHGIDGEVLVNHFTRTSFRVGLSCWIVPPTEEVHKTRIQAITERGETLLIKFEGIDSLNLSKDLSLRKILVLRRDLSPAVLEELENLEPELDLLSYAVIDERHGELGHIEEIIQTPANDVIVVQGRFGEVLIPFIDSVVLERDDERKELKVEILDNTIEGLS